MSGPGKRYANGEPHRIGSYELPEATVFAALALILKLPRVDRNRSVDEFHNT